jgi:hypothetical protein
MTRRTKLGNQMYVERIRRLCAKGLNRVQIAAMVGTNLEAVRRVCKRHGISVAVVKGYESRAAYFVKRACADTASSGSAHENH